MLQPHTSFTSVQFVAAIGSQQLCIRMGISPNVSCKQRCSSTQHMPRDFALAHMLDAVLVAHHIDPVSKFQAQLL